MPDTAASSAACEISWLQPGTDTSCGLREPHSVVSKLCFSPLRVAASSTGDRDTDSVLHFASRVDVDRVTFRGVWGAFARSQLDVWMWQPDTSWIWDAQLDNYRGGQMCLIGRRFKKKKKKEKRGGRGDEIKHHWHVRDLVDSVDMKPLHPDSYAASLAGGPDLTGLRRYWTINRAKSRRVYPATSGCTVQPLKRMIGGHSATEPTQKIQRNETFLYTNSYMNFSCTGDVNGRLMCSHRGPLLIGWELGLGAVQSKGLQIGPKVIPTVIDYNLIPPIERFTEPDESMRLWAANPRFNLQVPVWMRAVWLSPRESPVEFNSLYRDTARVARATAAL